LIDYQHTTEIKLTKWGSGYPSFNSNRTKY